MQVLSHLLQMRGLKQGAAYAKTLAETSHLLQMRGLKRCYGAFERRRPQVASFTDAWIETGIGAKKRQEAASRIFYRCVD